MLRIEHAALISASLLVSACSAVHDAYQVDTLTSEGEDKDMSTWPLADGLQKIPPPFDRKSGRLPNETEVAYTAALKFEDGSYRDRFMNYLLLRSDQICSAHKSGIIANAATANLAFGETAAILGGLGSIFTATSTVRALSGASAIATGARAQVNETIYQSYVAPAIVKAIETLRNTSAAALKTNVGKGLKEYSVDQMLNDVERHHDNCSFYAGLVSLTSASQRVVSSATELQARITSLRSQIDENLKLAAKPGVSTKGQEQIANLNGRLLQEIGVLQAQLAASPGAEAPSPGTNGK